MPVAPSVWKAVQAVRRQIAVPARNDLEMMDIHLAIHKLRRKAERIVADPDNLRAALELAPEIDAMCGKGSQVIAEEYVKMILGFAYHLTRRDSGPEDEATPRDGGELPAEVTACAGLLAEHAFRRVCGPRLRSDFQAQLRAVLWETLGRLDRIIRQPEHLERALETAGDPRARIDEREGAVLFLGAYWRDREPDEATVSLLYELEKDAPSRRFLVSVMITQIDLGLSDEFDGMCATEAWDEREG